MTQDPITMATEIQRQAAHPGVSVSLRASAGSGKTKVLVDRFLRLCIDRRSFQADPRSILAVTFTRKAAVEIQERLLKRSRELALATEPELKKDLAQLLGRAEVDIEPREMGAAANLYEKILEDLSGLNVGTIHAFCQSILNRFAAEAGLAPHAVLLENTDDLVEEGLDILEERISREPELQSAARQVAPEPGSVRSQVRTAYGLRLGLQRWASEEGEDLSARELAHRMSETLHHALLLNLELPAGDPRETIPAAMKMALDEFLVDGLVRIQRELPDGLSKGHADNLSGKLEGLRVKSQGVRDDWPEPWNDDFLPRLKGVFLTKSGTPLGHSRLKEVGPVFNEMVAREGLSLFKLFRAWDYLDLLDLNAGLLRLVLEMVEITRAIKNRDQVIDFQDLEETACRLMSDQSHALSLLYRLDDSINHILLDEFQDTNINQWEILVPFVEEFLSGGSDPDRQRTVFLVGDVKQSIYGFRGAEPDLFLKVTKFLRQRDQKDYTLPTNFRSLPAVVDSVGCVFTSPPLADLLPPGEKEKVAQTASRNDGPGSVTVLAPFEPGSGPDDESDDDRNGDQKAADIAAREAARLVAGGQVKWDDILVLSRTRTEIGLYEKAFRDLGIPIVSAGRGMLAASREVQDILALLRWLTYPEDDVALASVLRSPLLRVCEKDFQNLLSDRGLDRKNDDGKRIPPQGLWQVLRRKKDDPRWSGTIALLRGWRRHLGLDTCHELLRRIYREGDVLQRFQAASGDQARHNLIRLFDLALAPEVAATPTIRQLVTVIEKAARLGGEEEAVTPPAANLGRVRFMTIHGAKGLEAPVVFLVDADRGLGKESNDVKLDPMNSSSPILQKVGKTHRHKIPVDDLPESSLELAARRAREKDATEEANLLYVAMTRAKDHLYIVGGKKRGREKASYLSQLMAAAESGSCAGMDRQLKAGLGNVDEAVVPKDSVSGDTTRVWDPPAMKPIMRTVTPSAVEEETHFSAGGSDVDRRQAIRRGDQVHLLLQQATDFGAMPPGAGAHHQEAARIFGNPDFDWVFRPEMVGGKGLSEAPVIHSITDPGSQVEERVTGIIDRLVFRPGRVDIIDFKTNRVGPTGGGIPTLVTHYQPQLEAYRVALNVIYPEATIHTWLLFTDPQLRGCGRLEEVN